MRAVLFKPQALDSPVSETVKAADTHLIVLLKHLCFVQSAPSATHLGKSSAG